MRRVFGFTAVAALLAVFGASPASAQAVWFGGGATIPIGDYGDYANAGWMADAGVDIPLGDQGVTLVGEAFYGSNNHSDIDGDKTNLFGAMAHVLYAFLPPDEPSPFVFGGAGLMAHQYKSDTYPEEEGTDKLFAINAGAGVSIPLGSISGWALARFMTSVGAEDGNTAFVGVHAGITIPLGGDEGM